MVLLLLILTHPQLILPMPVCPKSARTELSDGLLKVHLRIKKVTIDALPDASKDGISALVGASRQDPALPRLVGEI